MTLDTPDLPLAGKRILIAKPGLDGHDIGAKIVALALKEAGADVIYTGLRKTPGYIAHIAASEDVDAIGLSLLSGSHLELAGQVLHQLEAEGISSKPVFIGGTIPEEDHQFLAGLGVRGIYTSDMALDEIISSLVVQLNAGTG